MKTTIITNSRKLPSFIKDHGIFERFDTVEKIFPQIGLKNFSQKLLSGSASESIASAIQDHLVRSFQATPSLYTYRGKTGKQIAKMLAACKPSDFISNGRIILLPRKLASKIANLNTAYVHCNFSPSHVKLGYYPINYYGVIPDRDLNELNSLNLGVNGTGVSVVFSSDDKRGVWDIATMSMRGISSCQAWDGSYKRNLIGSMIDPFCAIMYLTDNTRLSKGTKMLKRALVRYVINSKTKKPALFIERVYPDRESRNGDFIKAIFKKILSEKVGKNLPIVFSATGYSIPNSKIVKAMRSCGQFSDASDYCRSYRDSGIKYSRSSKVNYSKIKSF